jgi:hypothetical protein
MDESAPGRWDLWPGQRRGEAAARPETNRRIGEWENGRNDSTAPVVGERGGEGEVAPCISTSCSTD